MSNKENRKGKQTTLKIKKTQKNVHLDKINVKNRSKNKSLKVTKNYFYYC